MRRRFYGISTFNSNTSNASQANISGFNELLQQEQEANEAVMKELKIHAAQAASSDPASKKRGAGLEILTNGPDLQSTDELLQEMNDVIAQPISPVSGARGKPQGVNLKPFQSGRGVSPKGSGRRDPPSSPRPTEDGGIMQKKIILRLHKFVVDNNVDMKSQWKRMDINGDGFLSFDELYTALKQLDLDVSFSDAR